eukprot:SAG31_NODE_4593_length_3107_cov_5.701463_2_plen_166_part_00
MTLVGRRLVLAPRGTALHRAQGGASGGYLWRICPLLPPRYFFLPRPQCVASIRSDLCPISLHSHRILSPSRQARGQAELVSHVVASARNVSNQVSRGKASTLERVVRYAVPPLSLSGSRLGSNIDSTVPFYPPLGRVPGTGLVPRAAPAGTSVLSSLWYQTNWYK